MRRPLLLFLIGTVIFLVVAVYEVSTLLELLVVDGHQDAITQKELPEVGSERETGDAGQIIPRIIHQTYKSLDIPEMWKGPQLSCQQLHPKPDWEYKMWTDKMALEFIADNYPESLSMFEAYKYPIQRADAIRYFILDYYGGVYIDLDDGCNRPLEPLLKYPSWVRKTNPTGVSNDAMGAVPHHPFFKRVIAELPHYNRNWLLPYITVMASTGPLFLSIVWRLYSDDGFNTGNTADGGRIRILFPSEYNNEPWSFFTHHMGNSWHSYDVQLMFWMSRHWMFVTLLGFIIGFSLLFVAWLTYHWWVSPSTEPSKWRPTIRRTLWRLRSGSLRNEYDYALLTRRDL